MVNEPVLSPIHAKLIVKNILLSMHVAGPYKFISHFWQGTRNWKTKFRTKSCEKLLLKRCSCSEGEGGTTKLDKGAGGISQMRSPTISVQ